MLALIFLITGSVIMLVFNPWTPLLDQTFDLSGRVIIVVLLIFTLLLLRKSERLQVYWQVIYGLLVLVAAVSMDRVISLWLIQGVGLSDSSPQGWAALKLVEVIVVVAMVILLTRVAGSSLGSIYIQKGNLKFGLSVGIAAFVLSAAFAIPMAALFNARDLTLNRILP